ncbi:hypothetical protein JB92DRAFT_2861750 [Gautieria morchelliformis]|nr:hypothetical protein JB92DRAFT_2861750 [Gautieria morchelliformis]
MSKIKMQESTSSDEVVQLRKQAANKDNRYATLENELLKKNNDLLAVKGTLNETLGKLREEADRALKFESELNRQADDLRAERLTRQNLEASLTAAGEKLVSEEQTGKYLQMELDSYASRMTSQHNLELKRLQHEKSTLEARVRAFEAQSQEAKPSQPPTRLPRPTTFSSASSTAPEARIATLESELSKVRLELADASRTLAIAQQEAAKVPRLQSDLITADNARLRAEKLANAGKADVENVQELLREREEELEYWRGAASERSVEETRLEDLVMERDEAVKREEEARRRESALQKRIEKLEASEAELVMEREEALNDLHRLQAEAPADSRAVHSNIEELRSALAERESALTNARGYATELQQMYRDTLSACEDAEARVQALEHQLQSVKPDPPLLIVSPPSTASAPAPFLAPTEPITRMSAEDEAVVARLLTAIERLRGERDSLRRDLHFANVEHRMTEDMLRARLDATERELANKDTEMNIMRSHLQEVEASREQLIISQKDSSRLAVSSLITIQHFQSKLDEAEERLAEIRRTSDEGTTTQQTLVADLAASNAQFADATKEIERRDVQITSMTSQLSEYQIHVKGLENELSEAREELDAAEIRFSKQLSALPCNDGCSAEALKSHLEVLEQRILRRTEQIGMLQHDTKRLETNLRVAEETIGELSAELDTLGQERACLVDDCAQARATRDEAHRRLEEMEVEVESLANYRDDLEEAQTALQNAQAEVVKGTTSLETMVHMFVESVARSRGLRSALAGTRTRLATIEAKATLAEDRHLHDLTEIGQLSSEIDSMTLTISSKTSKMDALAQELALAKEETERLTIALECLKNETQSREQDATSKTQQLTAMVEGLHRRLAAEQSSREALSRELEAAQLREREIQGTLERVRDDAQLADKETQQLSSTVASLEQELSKERSSYSEAINIAQADFNGEVSKLQAQIDESRTQYLSLQSEHAGAVQDLTNKLGKAESQLAKAREGVACRESLEHDLHQMKSAHADELLDLQTRLDQSLALSDSLQAQVQTATETMKDLESGIEASAGRYDAAQAEIHSLEQALAAARAYVDEHDASIQALQREKTVLQIEHTRLGAERDRLATKFRYAEQQAKRSDNEALKLKSEVERLRGEVARLDKAAQTAEISLSSKVNQYEQKLAMAQQELQQQQSHHQCQETISELNEKIEYLEEMLRMRSVEIEENDDRFIEALKEKKRLVNKVDSLTRKVQSLQTKMAALTAAPPSTSTPPLPVRPKTPPQPVAPSMPIAGPSTQAPSRIPSSPAVLRSKTPDPSRKTLASRIATPEPPVPPLPNTAYKTPDQRRPASRADTHRPNVPAPSSSRVNSASPTPSSSGNRKRRVPDDFDSPAPGPVEAVVAPLGNTPPRSLWRPANDGRGGFTPSRKGTTAVSQRPTLQQPSPLKRSVAPLTESTNSPRGSRPIGLGQPASVSKPPMRSWLSKSRAPSAVSTATRSISVNGCTPRV